MFHKLIVGNSTSHLCTCHKVVVCTEAITTARACN